MTKYYRDSRGRFIAAEKKDILSFMWLIKLVLFAVGFVIASLSVYSSYKPQEKPLLDPRGTSILIKPVTAIESVNVWTGIASYYSRSGCIGCSKTLTMANGKPLDDNKLTIACGLKSTCKYWKMNSKVEITNLSNGMKVVATVTDKGGLRPGRIADLTIATRNAIKCSNLCKVTISQIK